MSSSNTLGMCLQFTSIKTAYVIVVILKGYVTFDVQ